MTVPADDDRTRALFEKRWGSLGFEGLLVEEQEYLAVWWLDAEVANGGFDQYFFNSAGDMAPQALVALEHLGADITARILREALAVFGTGGYTTERFVRQKRLLELSPDCKAFDKVTDAFYEWEEDAVELALDRLRRLYVAQGISA